MKVCAQRFNIYLTMAAALALLAGCQTGHQDKVRAALRVHVEVSPDPAGTSQTISLVRSDPVVVTIKREPILTEANVVAARAIEAPGGCAAEVQFDGNGTWLLEQYSAANPGRHLVIFGQWGETTADSRWLAAPLISGRIASGRLAFTPDATREEVDRLVLGLNQAAKKNRKDLLP